MGISPLTDTDLAILYAVKRLQVGTVSGLLDYLKSHGSPIAYSSFMRSLPRLIDSGLVCRDGFKYSLSVTGRHFISRIRNYLLRKRL
jgi:predicted transcriptional regulator